jgi:hypothetical protein
MHAVDIAIHGRKGKSHVGYALEVTLEVLPLVRVFGVHDELKLCALGVQVREEPVKVPDE